MAKIILKPSDIPPDILAQAKEVDLTSSLKPNAQGVTRELKCVNLEMNGELFWKAKHSTTGEFWTNNPKDPKIIDLVRGKNRGNIQFINGDVGRQGGRPKGSGNKTNAKDMCIMHNVHPAEFLVGVMKKDPNILRKYGIKDPKSISPKLQYDSGKELYNRMEGTAKARQLDANGDDVLEKEVSDKDEKYVVLLPEVTEPTEDAEEVSWELEDGV